MATVIDELIVKLGLDPANFTKEQKDAEAALKKLGERATKTHKDLQEHTKNTSGMFAELRGQVILLFAAFTAGKGIQQFISDTIASNLQLALMSRNMGVAITTLGEWQIAGEVTGGTAGGITSSFSSLNDQLQNIALTGKSEVIPYLRAMGVSLVDVNGKAKTAVDVYRDIAHSPLFQSLDPARQAAVLKGIGATPDMIRLIQLGGDALDKLIAKQQAYAARDAEYAKASAGLMAAWGEVKAASETAGETILVMLAPALERVLVDIKAVVDYLLVHKTLLVAVFTALTTVVLALSAALAVNFVAATAAAVSGGFAILTGGVSSLLLWLAVLTETALPALSAAFLAVGAVIEATPVGWILTGIAAIAAGAYLLYTNWDSVREWWRGLWDDMANVTDAAQQRIEANEKGSVWNVILSSIGIGGVQRHTGASGTSGGASAKGATGAFSNLFTSGEGGYNSVNLGQRFGNRSGSADLGNMTLDEVLAAQGSKQFNAAGHYQIIPSTLASAKQSLGLSGNEKFDKATQDRIFTDYLITVKQKEVGAYLSGKSNDLHAALMGLAREWASFTNPDTGRSFYPGQHATVSLPQEIAALNSARGGGGHATQIHVGTVVIHTQATDARGIADSLRSSLAFNDLAAQANGVGAVR